MARFSGLRDWLGAFGMPGSPMPAWWRLRRYWPATSAASGLTCGLLPLPVAGSWDGEPEVMGLSSQCPGTASELDGNLGDGVVEQQALNFRLRCPTDGFACCHSLSISEVSDCVVLENQIVEPPSGRRFSPWPPFGGATGVWLSDPECAFSARSCSIWRMSAWRSSRSSTGLFLFFRCQ